ncbi:MAG: response regulator [Chitinispirillales bacterium]|jgi:signal transduction histidine kinase/DNA-binding response OmpR family regulator/HPt (histidine-containing phosphotransfer) domain-containing protein|nr:response regulator [Chitinispirillales bacterium]
MNSEPKTEPETEDKRYGSVQEFVAFSIALFLIILIVGGTAFFFSMRHIIRDNKGNELMRMLENERIMLSAFVNSEIAFAVKMAESPIIRRYIGDPGTHGLENMAIEELKAYRGHARSVSVFWVSDKDKKFYIDDNAPYIVDPEAPENYWYNMTLYRTREYNFNINYNPDLKVTNLWINAPVFDKERAKPLGMVGLGVDITAFIQKIYEQHTGKADIYYFNAGGEITGSRDVGHVVDKRLITDILGTAGEGVLSMALGLKEGGIVTRDSPSGKTAVCAIPALEWYAAAIMPDTSDDYKTPVAAVFVVMLVVIAMIFVVSNIFIARFLRSLRRTMDSLKASSKYKSEFLAMMSHEIRTPMNAILGMAELAIREKDMPPRAREHVLTIRKSGSNLLSIINDILDFSKIDSGKLEIVPAGYRFMSLVKDVTSIIGIKVADSQIEFRVDVDDGIPQALVGDEARIRQIILNLLGNAVKYTAKGFVSLSVKCRRIDDEVVNIIIEIADSGRGIRPEDISKLFKDFVQIDLVKNKGIEGTGLGLAITRSLVKAMGGTIDVRSEYGKGSVFTVELPQEICRQEGVADGAAAAALFKAPAARVLVVDDVPTNLAVAQGLLSIYDIAVDTCLSGTEAIDAVTVRSYDIVFMDHMMPDMDGIEATAQIRALGSRYAELPIIALTANAVSGMKEMFERSGFNGYISKPIEISKLGAVLERWIPKEKQVTQTEEDIAAAVTGNPATHAAGNDKQSVRPEDLAATARTATGNASAEMKIEGLDTAKGLEMMHGNAQIYKRIIGVFHKGGQEKINEINDALNASDLRLYTTYVHGLKSALASIGAAGLSATALALEMAGRQENREYIDEHTPGFISGLEALLVNIGEFLGEKI